MAVHTPDWVKHAVFYQIFPDRFARSEDPTPRHSLRPVGQPSRRTGFQGGDLLGIVDKLDYLEALGVNALYLNPVFALANHRYHTYDYYMVDPCWAATTPGCSTPRTNEDACRAGRVFNHASRGFGPSITSWRPAATRPTSIGFMSIIGRSTPTRLTTTLRPTMRLGGGCPRCPSSTWRTPACATICWT